MAIDLRKCKPGDKLRVRLNDELREMGLSDIVTYVGIYNPGSDFPHRIKYSDGGMGSRTDDGHVFNHNQQPEDPDVIEILDGPDDQYYVNGSIFDKKDGAIVRAEDLLEGYPRPKEVIIHKLVPTLKVTAIRVVDYKVEEL